MGARVGPLTIEPKKKKNTKGVTAAAKPIIPTYHMQPEFDLGCKTCGHRDCDWEVVSPDGDIITQVESENKAQNLVNMLNTAVMFGIRSVVDRVRAMEKE